MLSIIYKKILLNLKKNLIIIVLHVLINNESANNI